MLNISILNRPNDREDMRDLEKMSTRGRMLKKIINRFDLLCLNKKEVVYYRAYDFCKLTIDLTLTNL